MNSRSLAKKILALTLPLTIFFSVGLYFQESTPPAKIKIVASVFPLKEFAAAVSGERGEASLILPPGAEVHTWQPRPSDIIKLSSADLFIYVGSGLEPWADDLLRGVRNPGLKKLEASRKIILLREGQVGEHPGHLHGDFDPHIWLDFEIDQKIVDEVEEFFSSLEPKNSAFFKKNAALYKEKLQMLDEKYKKGLGECSQRILILGGHAAFGYLAHRYGLRQIALYGVNPDSRPTPKQVVEVVALARRSGVKAIFFERYASDDLAKAIAKEIDAQTLVLDPAANLIKAELRSGITFISIMEKNLENLRNGLRCR